MMMVMIMECSLGCLSILTKRIVEKIESKQAIESGREREIEIV